MNHTSIVLFHPVCKRSSNLKFKTEDEFIALNTM